VRRERSKFLRVSVTLMVVALAAGSAQPQTTQSDGGARFYGREPASKTVARSRSTTSITVTGPGQDHPNRPPRVRDVRGCALPAANATNHQQYRYARNLLRSRRTRHASAAADIGHLGCHHGHELDVGASGRLAI